MPAETPVRRIQLLVATDVAPDWAFPGHSRKAGDGVRARRCARRRHASGVSASCFQYPPFLRVHRPR
eukprot:8886262-Alexandrium_andersonii.AAC.1